jgi:hypothetical protein
MQALQREVPCSHACPCGLLPVLVQETTCGPRFQRASCLLRVPSRYRSTNATDRINPGRIRFSVALLRSRPSALQSKLSWGDVFLAEEDEASCSNAGATSQCRISSPTARRDDNGLLSIAPWQAVRILETATALHVSALFIDVPILKLTRMRNGTASSWENVIKPDSLWISGSRS